MKKVLVVFTLLLGIIVGIIIGAAYEYKSYLIILNKYCDYNNKGAIHGIIFKHHVCVIDNKKVIYMDWLNKDKSKGVLK